MGGRVRVYVHVCARVCVSRMCECECAPRTYCGFFAVVCARVRMRREHRAFVFAAHVLSFSVDAARMRA